MQKTAAAIPQCRKFYPLNTGAPAVLTDHKLNFNPVPFNSLAIANYFVDKAQRDGRPVTPMKLLKLVYIAHGWFLALTGKALIREQIEAWKYGPVINTVYKEFREHGREPIRKPSSGYRPVGLEDTTTFLDVIWESYKRFSGPELSAMTHAYGSPWHQVWYDQGGANRQGAVISNEIIRDYFKKDLKAEPVEAK